MTGRPSIPPPSPDMEIRFPVEWIGLLAWQHHEVVSVLVHDETGERMGVAGGVLTDGSNLIGLCWNGGQNIARMIAAEDWAIEERVDPYAPSYARDVWSQVIESFTVGKREAEQIERALGWRS